MEATVLIVDDVRMFLEIQKGFLQNSKVKIITAKNGAEALSSVVNCCPDLVFMDLEMPAMDGVECCRAIKSRPESVDLPVVIVTGRDDEASQRNCRTAGCNELIIKPLDRADYLKTARRFLPGIDLRLARSEVRIPCMLHTRGVACRGVICDISTGGVFIATELQVEADRLIEISFRLPDLTQITCHIRSVWSGATKRTRTVGIGARFMLLPDPARKAIARMVGSDL